MKINEDRLLRTIREIGMVGAEGDNGITRLAYSKEYKQAAALLAARMEEAGLLVRTDGVGNLYGRRQGTKAELPVILFGSHLDTVKNGGLYDGNLGVCAALELIRVMNEQSIRTEHPLEIVAFIAEEGDTYGGTFGSRAITGLQSPDTDWLLARLEEQGISRQMLLDSRQDMARIAAFLELHIEQGGSLIMNDRQIGLVSGIAGISRYRITVTGETNHAGTTPMALRKDALTAAAALIGEINRIACRMGDPFVATIGVLDIKPGAVNVISGEVTMTLELRELDQAQIEAAVSAIRQAAQVIASDSFTITVVQIMEKPPVKTNQALIGLMEAVCREADVSYQIMASGAGHDAKALAQFVPTGMIFIPSVGGVSHCWQEYSAPTDIARGTEVLLQTILNLDRLLIEEQA